MPLLQIFQCSQCSSRAVFHILTDRGKSWKDIFAHGNIIKSGNREFLRHTDFPLLQKQHQLNGIFVGRREDSRMVCENLLQMPFIKTHSLCF